MKFISGYMKSIFLIAFVAGTQSSCDAQSERTEPPYITRADKSGAPEVGDTIHSIATEVDFEQSFACGNKTYDISFSDELNEDRGLAGEFRDRLLSLGSIAVTPVGYFCSDPSREEDILVVLVTHLQQTEGRSTDFANSTYTLKLSQEGIVGYSRRLNEITIYQFIDNE